MQDAGDSEFIKRAHAEHYRGTLMPLPAGFATVLVSGGATDQHRMMRYHHSRELQTGFQCVVFERCWSTACPFRSTIGNGISGLFTRTTHFHRQQRLKEPSIFQAGTRRPPPDGDCRPESRTQSYAFSAWLPYQHGQRCAGVPILHVEAGCHLERCT